MQIRLMESNELPDVVALEAALQSSPWSEGNFRDSHHAGHRLCVAEIDGRVMAYAVTSQVLDEAELLTLGVAKEAQRQGHGSALLDWVIDQASATGAHKMFLEVRASNESAKGLYVRHGFTEIGRRRGYYPAAIGREDAIIMEREMARKGG